MHVHLWLLLARVICGGARACLSKHSWCYPEAACDNVFLVTSAWQTTVLMDSWLKHKLAENSMMFGHRVGAIPTNVIDANRRYLV